MKPASPVLWKFRYTDQWGKRQTTRYLLSEEEALTRYGPTAEKVENTRFEPQDFRGDPSFSHMRGPKP